jgi:hypothetical protein
MNRYNSIEMNNTFINTDEIANSMINMNLDSIPHGISQSRYTPPLPDILEETEDESEEEEYEDDYTDEEMDNIFNDSMDLSMNEPHTPPPYIPSSPPPLRRKIIPLTINSDEDTNENDYNPVRRNLMADFTEAEWKYQSQIAKRLAAVLGQRNNNPRCVDFI